MRTEQEWRQFWNTSVATICDGSEVDMIFRDMRHLEDALREARQHIASLIAHGITHKYAIKAGRSTCGPEIADLPNHSLTLSWDRTTCPACLDAREEQQG